MSNKSASRESSNREYHHAQGRMALLPNYYSWIYGGFRKYLRGNVVELGCGAGLGIKYYAGAAQHVYAVDYNDVLLQRIAAAYPPEKVSPVQANLLEDWRELADIQADVVLAMDVLEHFENDSAFFSKASALLKPSGIFVVKVPAQSSLFSEVDEASGHYRRYDPDGLAALAKQTQLNVIELRYMNSIGALAYRRKRKERANFSRTFAPWQLRMANLCLPLIRLFDCLPGVKGLSLIGVFQKSCPLNELSIRS